MNLRWPFAALSASLALVSAAPAAAQHSGAALVGPMEPPSIPVQAPRGPDFRMPEGDLRLPPGSQSTGLVAAMSVSRRLDIGVGRFHVGQIAGPTTNTESPSSQARARSRSIAGFGFNLRFR